MDVVRFPYFRGPTIDDVMRNVIEDLLLHGDKVVATKGSFVELVGVLLELENPRARLSRTETRGKPFSCLGELCWYLAGSNNLDFISYYLPKYEEFAEGGSLFGAYGPRLLAWEGTNQVSNVTSLLRKKPTTRQAVIQIFDREDIIGDHKDVACTCTLQFMVRGEALQMFTTMRSNDVFLGLPHDMFSFTMLQEIIASDLSIEVGNYKHAVGSLHLYDTAIDAAREFLNEGWQSTQSPMPPMPLGDPWLGISSLLKAESDIRTGGGIDARGLDEINPYWADLIRLLQVLRFKRDEDPHEIEAIRGRMSSEVYRPFIDKVLSQIQ